LASFFNQSEFFTRDSGYYVLEADKMEHTMKGEHSNNPRVTVIIPCYNDGKYIDDAINSILNQTYHDFQIIVVDDGSTDAYTIDKLNNLKYPKTRVLYKTNGGVSSARNFGAKQSDSEYLVFLDADDFFDNTYLEKGVKILDNYPEVGGISNYTRYFYEENPDKITDYYRPKGGGIENFLLENNGCSNTLIRYKCWVDAGGYDENLLSHEDWDFWIKITKKGWLVYTIPEVLGNYRITKKSKYLKFKNKRIELLRKIIENNEDIYKEHVVECLYEKEKQIQYLKDQVTIARNEVKKSRPYRIGMYILYPFRLIKLAFKKIMHKE